MSAVAKLSFCVGLLLLQGAILILFWDGNLDRLERGASFVQGQTSLESVVAFAPYEMIAGDSIGAPLEFFDLVERDFPAAFDRHFDVSTTESMRRPYDEARTLGRRVYIREGCFQCHTQHVRNIESDQARWGNPSTVVPLDVREEGLPLTGLRRTGPDLANELGRRSNDWHAAHLYNPAMILEGSVMPRYPWLFEEVDGRIRPAKEGLGLIVYLQSLGTPQPPTPISPSSPD